MEIIDNTTNIYYFKDLEINDFFRYSNEICIKLPDFVEGDNPFDYNCYSLQKKRFYGFHDDEVVTPLNARLILTNFNKTIDNHIKP